MTTGLNQGLLDGYMTPDFQLSPHLTPYFKWHSLHSLLHWLCINSADFHLDWICFPSLLWLQTEGFYDVTPENCKSILPSSVNGFWTWFCQAS